MPIPDKLSYTDFAKKVKSKYPEYMDIDDLTLAKKVVEKYPEYKDVVVFEEPTPPMPTTTELLSIGIPKESEKLPKYKWTPPEPELKPAPPETIFTKAKRFVLAPFVRTPEENIAHSQNVLALSKLMPHIPITSIDENFSDIIRMPEVIQATGIQPGPRLKEMGDTAMKGAIVAGIINNPLATGLAVGGFTLLNEADNYITSKIKGKKYKFGAGEKMLSLLLPEEANEITKDTIDVIDFLGKSTIMGAIYKAAPEYARRLTQMTIEKYNLPQKVYISPEKVKSIFQTGEAISPQETDLIKSLGLSKEQWKTALERGIDIEVPTEKIITITDRPYWEKIKGLFGIKPFTETTRGIYAGKPRELLKQLPAPEPTPPTAEAPAVSAKPPEPPKVVKPVKVPSEIEVAKTIIPKKPSVPALSEVLVKNGYLHTTDLEVAARIKTTLPDGAYKVVGKEFVPSETPETEFPEIKFAGKDTLASLRKEDLSDTLKKASNFASTDETRYVLNGVFINAGKNQIEIVSTDGTRLYHKTIPTSEVKKPFMAIISAPQKIGKIAPALGDKIELRKTPETFEFRGPKGDIAIRIIDGDFPDYKVVYPKFITELEVDKNKLAEAVKTLSPYTSRITQGIKFEKLPKGIKLTAFDPDRNVKKEITIPYKERKIKIDEQVLDGILQMPIRDEDGGFFGFKVEYLKDIVNSLDGEKVFIKMTKDPLSAYHFSDEITTKPEVVPEAKPIPKELEPLTEEEINRYNYLKARDAVEIEEGKEGFMLFLRDFDGKFKVVGIYPTEKEAIKDIKRQEDLLLAKLRKVKPEVPTPPPREEVVKEISAKKEEFIEKNYQEYRQKVAKKEQEGKIAIPTKLPSIRIDFSKVKNLFEKLGDDFNKFRFLPELQKSYPDIVNDYRLNVIGAQGQIFEKRNKLINGIFGGLNEKDLKDAVALIFARDDLSRIKLSKISTHTEQQAEEIINNLEKTASKNAIEAANKWREYNKLVHQDLVERGKLSPEQMIEDYAPHYVSDYFDDWHFYIGIPRKLNKPYRAYTKKAYGTKKEYIQDLEALAHHIARVDFDNVWEDFVVRTLEKHDIITQLSKEEKIKLFGSYKVQTTEAQRAAFKTAKTEFEIPKSPRPGRIYDIGGKKYIGFSPEKGRYLYTAADEEGKEILALGRYKKTYLIPTDLADYLTDLNPSYYIPFLYPLNRLTSMFKSSAIFFSFFKYNINNFIGDSFNVYFQFPRAFKKIPYALKYLTTRPEAIDQEFRAAVINQDILSSTFIQSELSTILKRPGAIEYILKKSQDISQWRESILRLAVFKELYDSIETGEFPQIRKAIDWIDITGLSDIDAAGKIAREMMIDYSATSRMYNKVIRGLMFPFSTYYFKEQGLLGRYAQKHPIGFLLKIWAPFAALAATNYLMNKDTEEKLPDYVRNKIHFVSGTTPDGDAIVWTPQIPIDIIPGFTFVSVINKNALQVAGGEKSASVAAKDILVDTFGQSWNNFRFLFTPLVSTLQGLASNRDPFTKKEIVPKNAHLPEALAWKYRFSFIFSTLLPPFNLYLRSLRRTDPTLGTLKDFLKEWIGPSRALGFYVVPLTGELQEEYKQTIDKSNKKNAALVRIQEMYLNNEPRDKILEVIAEANRNGARITLNDIKQIYYNPKVQIELYKQKLRYIDDPKQRQEIKQKIISLQKLRLYKLKKAVRK